jgi:hypothetical protein
MLFVKSGAVSANPSTASVFKMVHSVLHDMDFAGHFSCRLCLWFPDIIHDKAALHAHMSSMLETIVKTRPQVRVSMLQTVLNAWTTSGRARESKRFTCLFGCDSAQDELKHYIQCPKLWSSIYSRLPDAATDNVLQRLNLGNIVLVGFSAMAIAFEVYHIIKNSDISPEDAIISTVRDFARFQQS